MKKTAILIGAGQRGSGYANYVFANPEDYQIVGVAEPVFDRREAIRTKHNVPEENCLHTWEDVFTREKWADCVFICTQDAMHYGPAMAAIEKGYDMLLEKPISPSEQECLEIAEAAAKKGIKSVVCHVLRYTPLFQKVKQLLQDGAVGKILTFVHNENVGDIHHAHSFTRGAWRKAAESCPMILAKSCHDMDIMQWLVDKECISLSSYGALSFFNGENKPPGSPPRCTDGCTEDCPYDTRKLYLPGKNQPGHSEWFRSAACQKDQPTDAEVEQALKTGPYGRCVFACDNDVVDHQSVNMLFEDDITVLFSMSSFTSEITRTFKIMGTKGELKVSSSDKFITHVDFKTREKTQIPIEEAEGGHGGGDKGIMGAFHKYMCGELEAADVSELSVSVKNHRLSFKAEESRVNGGVCITL